MDYLQGLTAISLGNPGRQVQSGAPIPARGLDVCKCWGHQAGDNGASLYFSPPPPPHNLVCTIGMGVEEEKLPPHARGDP